MGTIRTLRPSDAWAKVMWDFDLAHTPESLDALLDIPGVKLHPRGLEIPATAFGLAPVEDLARELSLDTQLLRQNVKYATVKPWRPSGRALLAHQTELAERLLVSGRVLCADDMGLGKTTSAITAAETVRRFIYHYQRPVFIFAPLRLRHTWRRELELNGVLDADNTLCVLETRDIRWSGFDPNAAYYFVHYDVIETWWSKLAMLRPCVSIADEAHLLKNGKARRTKATSLAFQLAPFRVQLTGTPIANHPVDLWSLLTQLCGERTWGGPLDFRIRYCGAYRTDYGHKDSAPSNVEELQTRMAPFYMRRTLETAGVELPPFRREILDVPPHPLAEQAYKARLATMSPGQVRAIVQVLLDGSTSEDALRLIGRLRKATSDAKFGATVELVENLKEEVGTAVVFTWERRTAERLAARVDGIAITGSMPQAARDLHIEAFQQNGGILVATYGALAEGVTLHRARHIVLHDLEWVASVMLQAEKRIHRIGQLNACTAYWMTSGKLFDALILRALARKLSDAELILNTGATVPELTGGADLPNDFQSRLQREIDQWMCSRD